MRKGLTELVFLLDRSGSMAGLERDTIGGFNAMLGKQRQAPGEAYVSTVLFSSGSTVLHDRVDIRRVEPMTGAQYRVGGGTALMDAVGDAIRHITRVHRYAREEDRPEHTLFVIITDGEENASRRYDAKQVRAMIAHEQEKYGWEFIFLGANIDAPETAARYGIRRDRAVTYRSDPVGTRRSYEAIDRAVTCVRSCEAMDETWKRGVDEDMRSR